MSTIFFNKNSKFKIASVLAYEVIDSRGWPTIACKVTTKSGVSGLAMVPSGASTGTKEALEMRDGEKNRFCGKGVLKAVKNVNEALAPMLIGMNVNDQTKIDQLMINLDGTENKSKLGANAILSVSLACARAAANANNLPLYAHIRKNIIKQNIDFFDLPVPMLNVINGGAHADNTIDFQEFMFVPVGANSIHQACQISSECFHALEKILKDKKESTGKGDEGGFAPNLKTAEEALSLMVEAIKLAGYREGINKDVAIALDVAASELYDTESKKYIFKKALDANVWSKDQAIKTTDQMIDYLKELTIKYPIISIEDGLSEDDWDGFKKLNESIGDHIQLVGDDIFCTNPKYLQKGIENKVANAILIKLNQIGTLTETIKSIQMAQNVNWCAIISHRSGETEDTTIADLAIALNSKQIKTGSMSRSERICKYNRLLLIENELGARAKYDGLASFYSINTTTPKKVNKNG